MFDVGFWELVVIFVVGLLVLGPERLPRVATQLGEWAGKARSMARVLKEQVREEMRATDPRQAPRQDRASPASSAEWTRPGVADLKPADTPADGDKVPATPDPSQGPAQH